MGKAKKAWKQNTKGHIPKDQFHQVKVGSIKKNKDSKFKNTPTGKVALINSSKVQNKNVKYVPSQKKAQEGFADTTNKNKNLPIQASKSNAKQLKQGSPNGKKKFSSKAKNKASKKKFIFNPEETLELFDDSSSEVNEETKSQKDVSLNKTDKTFKDEDSDTDTPDIFGNSLADDSDEDDEDFEEDEVEEEEDDDDDDSDEEETVEYKGVKMFEGLKHKAKKNYADKEAQENDDNDDDDDKGENDENMTFDESDEDDEDNEDEDDDDNDEQQIRNINGHGDISPMETDEDDDKDEDDDYDDDDDDDDMDEEMGLKALLGKSIADDDDDEDFNEENEDDEDDDISSEDDSGEDEDDEENDASNYKRVKAITKEKTDEAVNKEDIQVEKAKHTQYMKKYRESLERIVIIENISEVTTKGQIMQLFSQFGTIKQVSLEPLIVLTTAKDPTTQVDTMQPKLLSFTGKLLYSNEKSALNAVKAMHGKIVDGNYLMIQVLNKYNGPYDTGKVVFVTNLKKDVKLNDIWKAFRECGDINCVEVNRNQETMGCQCSYIHFSTEEAVSNALKLRNIVEVMGQKVSVFKIRFNPDDRDWYRNEAFTYRPPVSEKGTGRFRSWQLGEDDDGNPVKELKNSLGESAALNVKREGNIKKHKEQQGDDEGMKSTAFQGQKVNLKNKKKKNKLDKKKRKMAEKLTAKSVKI